MTPQTILEKFETIFIDVDSVGSKLAHRVMNLAGPGQIQIVESRPWKDARGMMSKDDYERSKKNLYLTQYKGDFFKRCPGHSPGLSCCNYFVLNFGQQCDLDCSYCYLQSFLNSRVMTLYTNLDQALEELKALAPNMSQHKLRVGTGEVVDSLSLDPVTLFSEDLIDFFKNYPNWTLEFKTKTNYVEQFLQQQHAGNVIVSWSINPQEIIQAEEKQTASLEERLRAAELCLSKGYKIAFHIDPMIWTPDWKAQYFDLAKQIHERFDPSQMPYMSIGALRFQPEQRHLMRERFGMTSNVTKAEMFVAKDGKLRYSQNLREEMFQALKGEFLRLSPKWKIFFCMEMPETWLNVDGGAPFKDEQIKDLFDTKILRDFNIATAVPVPVDVDKTPAHSPLC